MHLTYYNFQSDIDIYMYIYYCLLFIYFMAVVVKN